MLSIITGDAILMTSILEDYLVKTHDTFQSFTVEDLLYPIRNCSQFFERGFLIRKIGGLLQVEDLICNNIAIGVELQMTASFVLDDIIDNSYLRNNKQTTFANFGRNDAMLISNILTLLSQNAIASVVHYFPPQNRRLILNKFQQAFVAVQSGQHYGLSGYKLKVTDVDQIANLKSGQLLSLCCSFSSRIKNQDILSLNLDLFGKYLGILLQHQNDILDCKESFNDFFNNQANLVISHLYERLLLEDNQKILDEILYSKDKDSAIIQLSYLCSEKDANESAINYLQRYTNAAHEVLSRITDKGLNRFLFGLLELITANNSIYSQSILA